MPTSRARKSAPPSNSAATRRSPRTRKIPTDATPAPAADEPSTAVSDLKSDAGPRVLQLFDERPHPALPDGVLARYPLSDLSDEAIQKIADAVLAGLPAALARARMQP